MHELSLRIRNWGIIFRKYLHYKRNFRPSWHYFFPRLCQDYNKKQYYTFNTLIICSSASLYRRALRNLELRGKFILMDLLPRVGSVLRASRFIGTRILRRFLASPFSLSFGENFSKIIKFRAYTQSKGDFKSQSSVVARRKTQRSSETFLVELSFRGRTLNYANDVTSSQVRLINIRGCSAYWI